VIKGPGQEVLEDRHIVGTTETATATYHVYHRATRAVDSVGKE